MARHCSNVFDITAYSIERRFLLLNILMIDDSLLPEKTGADSSQKAIFCRMMEENFRRRIFLAKEFSRLGANVLLARLELCPKGSPEKFEFCESGGISQVLVKVPSSSKGFGLHIKELLSFSGLLSDNFASLGGLFLPDAVICGGILPFCASAAAKIAIAANAVLISELSCSPKELLHRLGLLSPLNPVLGLLKRSTNTALAKSDAVLGLFPDAQQTFKGARNLYPMNYPAPEEEKKPSQRAKELREALFAFREGESFVLAFCGKLESGSSLGELISICSGFGDKFALVLPGGGTKETAFKKLIGEKGITNVFFIDEVPFDEISHVLSGADAVFVSENDFIKGSASEHECFFSAFLAGRPVLASAERYSDFFRKSGGSVIIRPHHKESIRLGIKTLMEMSPGDREILGLSCREFGEKNSPENFAKDYFSLIDNLVKQKEIKK